MSVPTHRSILVNDDGWIISEAQPPMTARDLKEKMVDTYSGTPLGALLWCIGNREVYHFETRVGEMFGAGYDSLEGLTPGEEYTLFDDRDQANRAANIRSLIEERGGPLTAMVELCREAGLDIFPSIRMNSHYDTDPNTPGGGRFRREHPEALIGKPGRRFPQAAWNGECVPESITRTPRSAGTWPVSYARCSRGSTWTAWSWTSCATLRSSTSRAATRTAT